MKSFLLWLLTPFQILLQRIGKQEPKVTASQVHEIESKIEAGDIVLSFEYGRPTSILIRGFFDHAAIISSKMTVVEAVGDRFKDGVNLGGVREVDLEEWLYKKDYVAVVRPVYSDRDSIDGISRINNRIAAANSLYFVGKSYDYGFRVGDEKIYCSELVYLCYAPTDKTFMKNVDGEILPQMYFDLCQDLNKNDMYFELIYDSRLAK